MQAIRACPSKQASMQQCACCNQGMIIKAPESSSISAYLVLLALVLFLFVDDLCEQRSMHQQGRKHAMTLSPQPDLSMRKRITKDSDMLVENKQKPGWLQ